MTWLSQEAALLKAGAGKCVCSETEEGCWASKTMWNSGRLRSGKG